MCVCVCVSGAISAGGGRSDSGAGAATLQVAICVEDWGFLPAMANGQRVRTRSPVGSREGPM
jgi:hypothetical protein